jgi:hypothetical protein
MRVWSMFKENIRSFRAIQPLLNEIDIVRKGVNLVLKMAKPNAEQKAEVKDQLRDLRSLAMLGFSQQSYDLSPAQTYKLQGYLKMYQAQTGPEAMRNILRGINEQFNHGDTPVAKWLRLVEKLYDYKVKSQAEIVGLRDLEKQARGLQAERLAAAAEKARLSLEIEEEKLCILLKDADPVKNKDFVAPDYDKTYELVSKVINEKITLYPQGGRTRLLYAFRRFVKDCGGDQERINKGILAADKHGHWEIEIPQDLAKLREEAQTFVTDRIVELEKTEQEMGER